MLYMLYYYIGTLSTHVHFKLSDNSTDLWVGRIAFEL